MRHLFALLAILVFGCGEPEPEIRPITSRGEPRPRLAERSPEVVSPELRVRQTAEQAAAERERLGVAGGGGTESASGSAGAGGGGGGSAHPGALEAPNPGREPTRREIEAYQRELAAQLEQRVDPEDDPCDQLRATWTAAAHAADRATPEGRGNAPGATPTRAQMREGCRQMPPGYLRCMDRSYFDEHRDECQIEIQRLARRGRRRSDEAREQLDEIERGLAPDPTEPEPDEEDDG